LGAESGRGDNQLRATVSGVFSSKAPLIEEAVCASTPTRPTTETCAPATGAPDGIDNLTFDFSGGKASEKKQAEGRNV